MPQDAPKFEDVFDIIEEKGTGTYHHIKDKYYVIAEQWTDECVQEECGDIQDDDDSYNECGWSVATDFTYGNVFKKEIEEAGFQLVDRMHGSDECDDFPFGCSIAIVKKT